MAGCKSYGYWFPDGAKKCAHCGADLESRPMRRAWILFWKSIVAVGSLGAIAASIATCVMAGVMYFQTQSMEKQAISLEEQTKALKSQATSIADQTQILKKNFELQYIPIVKIGAVAFNFIRYKDTPTTESVAMYFTIPIENKHGFAYDVKIIKKELVLLRGKFDLKDESLQSALTQHAFELSPGQIKYDQIGIDENVLYFEQMMKGQSSFTLEYTIEYEAMPEVKKGIYIYNYVIEFKGRQQNVVKEETIFKEKP